MFASLIAGHPKKMIFRLSLLFLLMAGGLLAVVYTINMNNRAQAQLSQMLERAETRAQDKAATFNQWLSEVNKTTNTFTRADLVRIYLTERQSERDTTTEKAQSSYIQHALGDIQKRLDARAVLIVSPEAETIMAAQNSSVANLPQTSVPALLQATQGHGAVMGQMFVAGQGVFLEVFKPVFNLAEKEEQEVVGVVYMQLSLQDVAQAYADPLSPHDRTYFIAKSAEGKWQALTPGHSGLYTDVIPDNAGLARSTDGDKVLQGVFMLPSQRHGVVHHTDYSWAMADYAAYAALYKWLLGAVLVALAVIFVGLLGYGLAKRDRRRVQHLGQAMEAFMKAIEARDPYLSGHHERVARLALQLGNNAGLSVKDRATLYYSAKLSGIGRMFIPDEIANKKTKLTKKEREVMEQHVHHTLKVLDEVPFDLPVKETILQMHERGDGSGYPNGLTLADIDIKARILGLCDAYCALVEPRAYRKGMSHSKAIAELEKNDQQYDAAQLKEIRKIKS